MNLDFAPEQVLFSWVTVCIIVCCSWHRARKCLIVCWACVCVCVYARCHLYIEQYQRVLTSNSCQYSFNNKFTLSKWVDGFTSHSSHSELLQIFSIFFFFFIFFTSSTTSSSSSGFCSILLAYFSDSRFSTSTVSSLVLLWFVGCCFVTHFVMYVCVCVCIVSVFLSLSNYSIFHGNDMHEIEMTEKIQARAQNVIG